MYLPLLLCFGAINYLLRYARWQVYLKALGIQLKPLKSLKIFLAGLTMAITPGKFGEALKAHLLKKEGNYPYAMGLSIVFVERLMDLIAVVFLVTLGLNVVPFTKNVVLVGILVCLLLILLFVQPTFFRIMASVLRRVPWIANRSTKLLEMQGNIQRLMTPRYLLLAFPISCIAWFSECLILYFTLYVCDFNISWLQATFAYAASALAGALSVIPGGLVVTEFSMTGLLFLCGLDRAQAVFVTFIVRFCTLWFGVFLGMLFLLFLQRKIQHRQKHATN